MLAKIAIVISLLLIVSVLVAVSRASKRMCVVDPTTQYLNEMKDCEFSSTQATWPKQSARVRDIEPRGL